MAKQSGKWITYLAFFLILFGFVEDLTAAFLLAGILTSFAGLVLLAYKGLRRRR